MLPARGRGREDCALQRTHVVVGKLSELLVGVADGTERLWHEGDDHLVGNAYCFQPRSRRSAADTTTCFAPASRTDRTAAAAVAPESDPIIDENDLLFMQGGIC